MFLDHPDQSEQVPAKNFGKYDIVVNLRADIFNEIARDTTGAERHPLVNLPART